MLPILMLSIATATAQPDDELRAWRDDAASCRIGSAGVQKFYDKCMKRLAKNKKKSAKGVVGLIETGNFLAASAVDERLKDIAPNGENPLATVDYFVSHIKCEAGDKTDGVNVEWETRALEALATTRRLEGAAQLTAYLLDQNDQKNAPNPQHVTALKETFAGIDAEKLKGDLRELQGSKPSQFSAPRMYLCVAPINGYILFDFPFVSDANDAQKELLATFPD